MSPAERDARIRELKRLVGLAGTELADARAAAPKSWTGKCARAARSFGAYDRGRCRVQDARRRIDDLNRELAELQSHARRRQAAAERRRGRSRATGSRPQTFRLDGLAVEILEPGRVRFNGGRPAERLAPGDLIFLESAEIGRAAALVEAADGMVVTARAAD